MTFPIEVRIAKAINEIVNIGLDEMFSPEDAEELRRLHRIEAEKSRGKSELARSLREDCIGESAVTRDGAEFYEVKEILERWSIGLADIGLDPTAVLKETFTRGRITSELNYYVCRTLLETVPTLEDEVRDKLDQLLRKYEHEWEWGDC